MSFVNRYGNIISEDGWRMVDEDECNWVTVPGTDVHLEIRKGIPTTILTHFAARFNQVIEPLRDADSACWTPTNSVATSNHMAGTAMDLDWELHPFHVKGTFGDRLPKLRALLNEFKGCVWWGGDWNDPIDEMHFQLNFQEGYVEGPPGAEHFVLDVDQRLIDLANEIQAVQPPPPPPPPGGNAVDVLVRATGITVAKATEILPTVISGLRLSQCDNVNRVAMWLAQMGHESASFVYTEEIQSGDESTDRWLYKGRTWIQITWRTNYAQFSQWLFDKGLISSPTYFVDHPKELAQQQWAGIGPAWYWTVARPQINSLCDKRDLFGVTQAINGGQNGAPDRKRRYDMALVLGDQLLALISGTQPQPPPQPLPQPPEGADELSAEAEQMIRDIHAVVFSPQSPENIYRSAEEEHTDAKNLVDSIRSTLSMTYEGVVERMALLGEAASIAKVVRVARGQGPEQRPWAVQRAQLIWQKGLADSTAPTTVARMMPTPIAMTPPQLELPPLTAPQAPPPQVVYLPAPIEAAHTNGSVPEEKPKSTGETIGQLYSALEDLKLADVLPIEARAPLAALISVLQTKNGSQL